MRRPEVKLRVEVSDPGHIGRARRTARRLAEFGGLSESRAEELAIATGEAAANIVFHGSYGEVLLSHSPGAPFELLAIDHGPGLVDVARCMTDGFSTRGTAGVGLGAIRRLANQFALHSSPRGLILWATFEDDATATHMSAVCLPFPGERACGDGWAWAANHLSAIVVDGIGHGAPAERAALAAQDGFLRLAGAEPQVILAALHPLLRGTRCAAAAIARIDRDSRRLDFAGIGNINALIVGPDRHVGLVSSPGVVGDAKFKARLNQTDISDGDVLVLHSDGIQSRWRPDAIRPALGKPPAIIAALLLRDYGRGRDDVAVMAVDLEALCAG